MEDPFENKKCTDCNKKAFITCECEGGCIKKIWLCYDC
jgi:hypothetical protein